MKTLTRSLYIMSIITMLPLLGGLGCSKPEPTTRQGVIRDQGQGWEKLAPSPQGAPRVHIAPDQIPPPGSKLELSDEQWKQKLTPEQYYILREAGTERPFTGLYVNMKEKGTYHCVACGAPLFASKTKFESGTGWPSFWEPVAEQRVGAREDNTLGMSRVEVYCDRCGGHLGHVFDDGPKPTGKRYCINSAALIFSPADQSAATQPSSSKASDEPQETQEAPERAP